MKKFTYLVVKGGEWYEFSAAIALYYKDIYSAYFKNDDVSLRVIKFL